MAIGTVVLCPDLVASPFDRAAVARGLDELELAVALPVVPPGDVDDDPRTAAAHWVAHLSIAIGQAHAAAPLVLVVPGRSGALAPALALSQRAARRAVRAYVLIDAALPSLPADAPTGEWPDAPVHYVASPAAPPDARRQAELRTWTVDPIPDLESRMLADAIGRAVQEWL